jgi:hypothetical protein
MAAMAAWHPFKQAQGSQLPRIKLNWKLTLLTLDYIVRFLGEGGTHFVDPCYSQLLHDFCKVEVLPSFPPPYMRFFFQM